MREAVSIYNFESALSKFLFTSLIGLGKDLTEVRDEAIQSCIIIW